MTYKTRWTNYLDRTAADQPGSPCRCWAPRTSTARPTLLSARCQSCGRRCRRQFIAGKKLRWAGAHLIEHTADGEQALFRFDGISDGSRYADAYFSEYAYYDVTIQGETIQVTSWGNSRQQQAYNYSFRFSGGAGPVRVYDVDAVDYYELDAGVDSQEGYELW